MRSANGPDAALCSVEHLSVHFPLSNGTSVKAIDDVTIEIRSGDALGLVGESGSGKSLLALAILGLLPAGSKFDGRVTVDGVDVLSATSRDLRRIRGRSAGIILQDPTGSLNPIRRISRQLREAAKRSVTTRREIANLIAETLLSVGLQPELVLPKYSFELSGGMNQRVAIAMALLQDPQLLIGDEPTTALDTSVQTEILGLLRAVKRQRAMALLLISHDLAVVYQSVQTIAVMYAGKLVEYGPAETVISKAAHPYTRALVHAVPTLASTRDRLESIPGQFAPRLSGDTGCPFRARCTSAMAACDEFPAEVRISGDHKVWCWLYSDGASGGSGSEQVSHS